MSDCRHNVWDDYRECCAQCGITGCSCSSGRCAPGVEKWSDLSGRQRGELGVAGKRKVRGRKMDGEIEAPTEQQAEQAVYELHDIVDRSAARNIVIGKAFRRRPMVDILAQQGLFSTAEYKALKAYRHFASVAERSPLRDSLNRQRGGGSGDIGAELATAIRVTTDAERAAGSLRDILRAVIVEDISLSQWAMRHYGSTEKCRERRGLRVCTIEATPKALQISRLEIQMAAKRVEAEIAA